MNDETSRKRKLKTGGSWRWEMIGRHWIGYILREKERRGEGEEEGEKEKKKGRRRRRRHSRSASRGTTVSASHKSCAFLYITLKGKVCAV
jgi:hypothetical protein